MLCYVMLCYVMLCYVMLCYVTLPTCYVSSAANKKKRSFVNKNGLCLQNVRTTDLLRKLRKLVIKLPGRIDMDNKLFFRICMKHYFKDFKSGINFRFVTLVPCRIYSQLGTIMFLFYSFNYIF